MSDMTVKYSNPSALAKPLGAYSHIARARVSDMVFIAGQLAVNDAGETVGKGDFAAQMRQVFENLKRALESEGLNFANVTKFTTYSRALAGYRSVHGRSQRAVCPDLSGRPVSAQHFADGRPAGRRAVSDRSGSDRGSRVKRRPRARWRAVRRSRSTRAAPIP